MIKQNKTKLHSILGIALLATMAVAGGCNNSGESKDEKKDTTTNTTTPPPPASPKDSTDTMEKIPGNKAPGNDVKPQ